MCFHLGQRLCLCEKFGSRVRAEPRLEHPRGLAFAILIAFTLPSSNQHLLFGIVGGNIDSGSASIRVNGGGDEDSHACVLHVKMLRLRR